KVCAGRSKVQSYDRVAGVALTSRSVIVRRQLGLINAIPANLCPNCGTGRATGNIYRSIPILLHGYAHPLVVQWDFVAVGVLELPFGGVRTIVVIPAPAGTPTDDICACSRGNCRRSRAGDPRRTLRDDARKHILLAEL